MSTAIVWFRRDLRLADNPALRHAVDTAERVVPVYIHAPDEEAPWQRGAASQWWLHHSLTALKQAFADRDVQLLLRSGDSLVVLRELAAEVDAQLICWNRCYEPALIERDTRIKQALRDDGVQVSSHNAALLTEPWTVQNKQGKPYRVFTPYWKAIRERLGASLAARPDKIGRVQSLAGDSLDDWQLLPTLDWADGFTRHWTPGEAGAQAQLRELLDGIVEEYLESRDLPAQAGTSRLSPALHFGEIGPRQIAAALQAKAAEQPQHEQAIDAYLRQLGWRDFAHHMLYHFPETPEQPLDARFARFPWQDDAKALRAWRRGQTGIPVVDAGMRQLWATGWMHNRVRMIVASLLCKNLQQDWRSGAAWFWDTLVDADLANNTMGWQWVAGCGADASPYFRVFNPVRQGERFDADGSYVARWVPELAKLPAKWRHCPWDAPPAVLGAAGITLGQHYPRPIVDLASSRSEALAVWDKVKNLSKNKDD